MPILQTTEPPATVTAKETFSSKKNTKTKSIQDKATETEEEIRACSEKPISITHQNHIFQQTH